MARTRAAEHSAGGDGLGGAAHPLPPPHPLRLVQAAVAGDDLHHVTRQAAEACGRAVAITLPAFGSPVHWPQAGAHPTPTQLRQLLDYAGALAADRPAALPDDVVDAVPVRVGQDVVGVVAALGPALGPTVGPAHGPTLGPAHGAALGPALGSGDVSVHAWLSAAAAAAAITTLIRGSGALDAAGARRSLLAGLELNPPADVAGLLAHGRRLGVDLSHGAVGLCALHTAGQVDLDGVAGGALFAEVGAERLLGLIPLAVDGAEGLATEIVGSLRASGAVAASSVPRRTPEQLQEALVEAAVLAELGLAFAEAADATAAADSFGAAEQETYRLLLGVLMRSPAELVQLRGRTVGELQRYDTLHDTELLSTLGAFFAHHGSTTETAEAMSLHRHTVGYRLARVQEVAGLSPYESDGRERLSLGLKADRILVAESERLARTRPG
jgi:hypothetical protein